MTIKPTLPIDRERAVLAYKNFLWALGYDFLKLPSMNSLASGKNTAERAVDAVLEFLTKQQEHFGFTTFDAEGVAGMIAITNIEFFSLCAHHVLPYIGRAHVGYLPDGKVCGLSKIVRVVDHYAHRLSIQETLTSKVATFIQEQLKPQGCGVVIEAQHLCMSLRGVERPGHVTITSDMRGCFQEVAVRQEFMAMIARTK